MQWLDGTERISRRAPSGSKAPYLLIVAADGTWTSQQLPAEGALVLGRSSEVDVSLHDRSVSRLHARLEVAGGLGPFRVVDLGSANGTLVGGQLLRDGAAAVRPGEPILIGRTVVTVHVPPAAERSPPGPSPSHLPRFKLAEVDALVAKAAPTMISVLLLGETGVGKDVVAERLHRQSTRASGPLVRLNCAGLSAALLESELFGHERGAFTGAAQAKAGLLETAAGGTVFLDEVGEMPMEVQAKLLLAIEQRLARRVGATRSEPIDVRFISATHRDIEAESRRDRFRADFYYRINGLTIRIPPLRERRDELDGLILQFADEAAARLGLAHPPSFDQAAHERLHRYPWPGNVRELRSVVERAVLLADADVVTASLLTVAGLPGESAVTTADPPSCSERDRVVSALAECGGNQSRAARVLGISRNTLLARIRQFGLARPRGQEELQ